MKKWPEADPDRLQAGGGRSALGFWISYRIMKYDSGEIFLESEQRKRSSLFIDVPALTTLQILNQGLQGLNS